MGSKQETASGVPGRVARLGWGREGGLSEKLQEFFISESRLSYDRLKRFAFQIAVVKRDRDSNTRPCRMLQNVVASGHAMNNEARPLKSANNIRRSDGW